MLAAESEHLLERQLIVVTGKGGVGKSTVCAILSRVLADCGRKVLALEIDPRESVNQMLGVPPSGGEVVKVSERLWLQNFDLPRVVDEVVRERVGVDWIAKRVLKSPVYHQFSAGAPGLKELALLGHCQRVVEGHAPRTPQVDVVVLDAPATGHGASLLRAPALVGEVIADGPFGKMTAEVAEFIADPRRCGVVLVTLAEEMPVNETLEVEQSLGELLERGSDLLVVNGLYPPFVAGSGLPPEIDELWQRRRAINEHEMERLNDVDVGRVELTLEPLENGPELSCQLADQLLEGLSGVVA